MRCNIMFVNMKKKQLSLLDIITRPIAHRKNRSQLHIISSQNVLKYW